MPNSLDLAPIVLFVYNRLEHTKKTIDSLKLNQLASESSLFIFSDGPKDTSLTESVGLVRHYLAEVQSGFKNITVIERETNMGLANSIISGVTEIIKRFGKVIVLEDDMITSPFFLQFMNEALALYEPEEMVGAVSGYIYPIIDELPTTFLLKGPFGCWGWGTWKRNWDLFNPNGTELLEEISRKRRAKKQFDVNGTHGYVQMLKDQIAKKNNSWAIRFYASMFLNKKLFLFPGKSLIINIGFDGFGVHCGNSSNFDVELASHPIEVKRIPVKENQKARKSLEKFFGSLKRPIAIRVISKIGRLIRAVYRRYFLLNTA